MDHDPAAYGRELAADYDTVYAEWPDTAAAVDVLYELAAGGEVLEFGVGTGRLALPLLARGLTVAGIEGSPEMVERLRTKAGGGAVRVAVGDFASTRVEGTFSLVVLALNTIFALPSAEQQAECFGNAARHLAAGGCFVVEAFVLDPRVADGELGLEVRRAVGERVELQVSDFDARTQRIRRVLVNLANHDVRVHTVNDQYASPEELDEMGRRAGMRPESRWSSWSRAASTAASRRHVSVYRLG